MSLRVVRIGFTAKKKFSTNATMGNRHGRQKKEAQEIKGYLEQLQSMTQTKPTHHNLTRHQKLDSRNFQKIQDFGREKDVKDIHSPQQQLYS